MASLNSLPIQAVTFEDIKREVQDLVAAINSKEDQDRFPDTVNQYNKYSEDLSVLDGVPMLGTECPGQPSLSSPVQYEDAGQSQALRFLAWHYW